MIQIAPQVRILVAIEAIDCRKGIDRIAQLCREKLNADPFSGYLFIFRSRRGTSIRILQFDGQGFWLATNQPSSHYTSFSSSPTFCRSSCKPAARSTKRSHRLQCFAGVFGPGGS